MITKAFANNNLLIFSFDDEADKDWFFDVIKPKIEKYNNERKKFEKPKCGNCKHLEHDGMFGIFCGVGGNNRNYDCSKYEER